MIHLEFKKKLQKNIRACLIESLQHLIQKYQHYHRWLNKYENREN